MTNGERSLKTVDSVLFLPNSSSVLEKFSIVTASLSLVLFHCWEIAAENIVEYFGVYVHLYRVWTFQEAILWNKEQYKLIISKARVAWK